jgi:hypothetical protein
LASSSKRHPRLIGIPVGLALLDFGEQLVEPDHPCDRDAGALERHQVGLAAPVRKPAPCAHCRRFQADMLVGFRILQDGRGMDAGLGGKSRGADIRRLRSKCAVEQLVEGVARPAVSFSSASGVIEVSNRSAKSA